MLSLPAITMSELLAIAVGGALGAIARYLLGESINAQLGNAFPYGIFAVNALGSFAIGVLFVLLVENQSEAGNGLLRSLLMVGFLGAFTTFSTFSLQTLALIETGRWLTAALYSFGSLATCLGAVALGVWVSRLLTSEL